jgi:hypothetical protein
MCGCKVQMQVQVQGEDVLFTSATVVVLHRHSVTIVLEFPAIGKTSAPSTIALIQHLYYVKCCPVNVGNDGNYVSYCGVEVLVGVLDVKQKNWIGAVRRK